MNDLLEKYREERFAKNETMSFSPEQIQEMIKKGSDKKLGKIRLNIKLELLLTIAISVMLLSMIGLSFYGYEEVIVATCISTLVSAFYYLLYRRIKTISFTQSDVKTSLTQAINHLENTLKLYYRIAVFSFPTLYFSIYIFMKLFNNESFLTMLDRDWKTLTVGVLVSIILPVLTKWVLKHLYQKHIEELKTNLNILKM